MTNGLLIGIWWFAKLSRRVRRPMALERIQISKIASNNRQQQINTNIASNNVSSVDRWTIDSTLKTIAKEAIVKLFGDTRQGIGRPPLFVRRQPTSYVLLLRMLAKSAEENSNHADAKIHVGRGIFDARTSRRRFVLCSLLNRELLETMLQRNSSIVQVVASIISPLKSLSWKRTKSMCVSTIYIASLFGLLWRHGFLWNSMPWWTQACLCCVCVFVTAYI